MPWQVWVAVGVAAYVGSVLLMIREFKQAPLVGPDGSEEAPPENGRSCSWEETDNGN